MSAFSRGENNCTGLIMLVQVWTCAMQSFIVGEPINN